MQPLHPAELLALAQVPLYLIITNLALLSVKTPRRPRHALAVYALVSVLWLGAQIVWSRGALPVLLNDFKFRLPLYGLLLLAMCLLWFVRAYLSTGGSGWGWLALGVIGFGSLFFVDSSRTTISNVIWTGGGRVILRDDFIRGGIALLWCLFTGASAITTLLASRRTHQPLLHNRIRYLVTFLLLVIAGQVAFMANYWTLGSLICLPGVLVAAYATLTPRLPSLQRALLRSLSYLITTGMALLFYLAALSLALRAFRATQGSSPWLVGALLAAALAVFFTPLLGQAQKWIDRLIAGVSHDPVRIQRQYSQDISNILELDLLAKVVIDLISKALGISHGYLFTVSYEKGPGEGNCYRLQGVKGKGDEAPPSGVLSEESPLGNFLRYQRLPLSQSDIDNLPRFAGTPADERLWLSALQMELYVPIYSKDEWIGLLALGPKNSGEPFWDDDQFLLSSLADQTAVALENARLVESLVRLNNDFRQAIDALDQANRNLERLDRTKTDFISIASHELHSPLTLVDGYSQVLLEEPELTGNPQYARMLSGIHNGAQRLHEIVESMLDMAKIDTRELQLNLQPVCLGDLIDALYKQLEPALQERNQKFEAVSLDSLPDIQGDREALLKVFRHLLTNAIKYTPDGGKITVSGRAHCPGEEPLVESGVELVISDTGIGIDPGMQEVIFTKFYQTGELALHSSGKTKFKGAGPGLGLAIAKGIVEAHSGRIWVESPEYDEIRCPGSQFYVFLPVHQPEKSGLQPVP